MDIQGNCRDLVELLSWNLPGESKEHLSQDILCLGRDSNPVPASAASITTGYRLEDRVLGVRVPVGTRFSPFHSVQSGSGAHPASYRMGTGGKPAKA
jgi:hypothetical protein